MGFLVINPDGEIATSNDAASGILGYACRMFEGKGWGDLFLEDSRNQALCYWCYWVLMGDPDLYPLFISQGGF